MLDFLKFVAVTVGSAAVVAAALGGVVKLLHESQTKDLQRKAA